MEFACVYQSTGGWIGSCWQLFLDPDVNMKLYDIIYSDFIVCVRNKFYQFNRVDIYFFDNTFIGYFSLSLFSLSLSVISVSPPHHLSIPVQDRHCNYCNTGAVEDEFHFLLCWSFYSAVQNIITWEQFLLKIYIQVFKEIYFFLKCKISSRLSSVLMINLQKCWK